MARRGKVVFGDPPPTKTCPACLSDDLNPAFDEVQALWLGYWPRQALTGTHHCSAIALRYASLLCSASCW